MKVSGIIFDACLIHHRGANELDDKVLARYPMERADPPTAVLTTGENVLPRFYRGLSGIGLIPGRDMSVIGTRANPFTEALSPHFEENRTEDIAPMQQR
ncbi:hypothetical protein [Sphingomonas sp.]|uniref:hypothetical protein n=1 Tax=Sphingomonas sp. TaxID=28214 RepID=UPI0035AF77FF